MDKQPSRRLDHTRASSSAHDLVAVVVVAGVAELLAFLQPPIPTALQLVVFLPMLLFVPGYALVAALFPAAKKGPKETVGGGIDVFERLLLAVVVSVAVAVLSGVLLDWSRWLIDLRSVVLALLVPTVLGVVVAAVRRRSLPARERFDYGLAQRFGVNRWREAPRFSRVSNGLVVLAIVLVAASVVYVAATPPNAETPTEFYEVSIDESGNAVAGDYPTEFVRGEATTLHLRIDNHERETVRFAGVVQLQQVSEDGTVTRTATLSQFGREVPADARLVVDPTVTPPFTGERLRLTMLLYRGEVPENPTVDNAYREVHRWVSVNASG
ncbi:DUF1616 domain-containing protein [Halomarina salina]|uniref:DUF1616 domain-containing protein n=1 Tax=Halomarina salina TaxID=1872699 RepID=A0ABD5RI51_9EURY|nr:DUF1616 domain-containing protein [Halomarina salina]